MGVHSQHRIICLKESPYWGVLVSIQHPTSHEDQTFSSGVEMLQNDKSWMWTSVELFKVYSECGGVKLSIKTFIHKVKEVFGNDLSV